MKSWKKAFSYQTYLIYCSKKHLVISTLSVLLLLISNITFAMEDDEEKHLQPIQNKINISLIDIVEDLHRDSLQPLFKNQEDKGELDVYTKKLYNHNIEVKKVFSSNEKEVRLVFKKSNWILSLFNNGYDPIFSMFPRILSLSVTLDVSQKGLTLEELRQAVELTRNNASIVDFTLSNLQPWNPWTEEGHSQSLLMALAIRNSLMRGLTTDLAYTFFLESNFEEEAISEGLKNSTSIKRVDFLLNGERGKNLIRSLKENKELESIAIALYGRNLSPTEVEDLTYLIISSLSLKSLKLQVPSDDFLILDLATALKESVISLKQLTLISAKETKKEEEIKTETMKSFFKAISINKSLHVLRLKLPLSLQSFQDLAEALKVNKTLKVLALPENNINDKKISSLAESLKENISLTSLDLSFNSISDEGANSLLDMLRVNSSLESLYLFHNKIGHSTKMEIDQLLHQRRAISFVENKIFE